jgi:hypothetical protein
MTAAHVVFDDYSLSWTPNVRWLFQQHSPDYTPAPKPVRGFYISGSYAAQRQLENTPGISSLVSFDLDVAALFFYEAAGRGGYGGYLVSESPSPQWLQFSGPKVLVGYPIEGVPDENRGKMHAIGPLPMAFTQTRNEVFGSGQIRSFPGNSGGPVCVDSGSGIYAPVGVYVGESDNAIVRAIDVRAVELINAAELAANRGTNSNTGGVIRITPIGTLGSFCDGYLTMTLTPPAAYAAGAAWRVAPRYTKYSSFTNWTMDRMAQVPLQNGPFEMEFRGAAGFLPPAPPDLSVPSCIHSNLVFDYFQLLPKLEVVGGRHLRLSGVTGTTYQVEYRSSLGPSNSWTALTNISFLTTNSTAVISNALGTLHSNRFWRARQVP